MKAAKNPLKPFWEMNTEELAEATREFDRESAAHDFHALSPAKKRIWQRLKGKREMDKTAVSEVRVCSQKDVTVLREKVKKAAAALGRAVKKKISARDPLEVVKDLKLELLGFDPYVPGQRMNLVEQVNQSATLLVACAAVERLLRKHPSKDGYVISRPTAKGFDLWAVDASVAAEVFAATNPASNQKFKKDLEAVLKNKEPLHLVPPRYRYVFFVSRSLKGFPPGSYPIEKAENDPTLGSDIWYLAEHGQRSVTVVRLPEEAVFGA